VRISVDVGGTFTDLVLLDDQGQLSIYKAPTTPENPVVGVFDAIDIAAASKGVGREDLLAHTHTFLHATTRATNAVLTNTTARTAFLTTKGHPDVLLMREGGRDQFNLIRPYPEPYIPRALTFEVPERITSQGGIASPLDEDATINIIRRLDELEIEAVAVCLLWSIVNAEHELRVGELLKEYLPGVPYTLSHQLNPILREYRRASSTAIDASLKPIMTTYIRNLDKALQEGGFSGRLFMVASSGGVMNTNEFAEAPIYSVNSGPSMAPLAGRHYASIDGKSDTYVVADTGGTSYDVSLVRRGRIPWTREAWLGTPFVSHMTGFPSVDVKSIGAGGGSIAWVDAGGLLHVGPQSAGADPGPVCYGRGGAEPTVTDACLVLGYLDPAYFLGGAMSLDVKAAEAAIKEHIATKLGLNIYEAAAGILTLMTENMVQAIEEITLQRGIDPRQAVLVGGGGAAGFNVVATARRLGCMQVIVPETSAVLSAIGAQVSELTADHAATFRTITTEFDFDGVEGVLRKLRSKCEQFINEAGADTTESSVEIFAHARYPREVWELEVPLPTIHLKNDQQISEFAESFHAMHEEVFGVRDPQSPIEIVGWRGHANCTLQVDSIDMQLLNNSESVPDSLRQVYFPGTGMVDVQVRQLESMMPGDVLEGPAIINSAMTTVVIDPGARAERTSTGSLSIVP